MWLSEIVFKNWELFLKFYFFYASNDTNCTAVQFSIALHANGVNDTKRTFKNTLKRAQVRIMRDKNQDSTSISSYTNLHSIWDASENI